MGEGVYRAVAARPGEVWRAPSGVEIEVVGEAVTWGRGQGASYAVVYLEAGELLVCSVQDFRTTFHRVMDVEDAIL